jgi:fructose-specific phosphotransferase system IIC component
VKRVALVGSSGGNLHRLGGNDAAQLIRSVQDQLSRAGAELVAVCFVAADASLDSIGTHVTAALWRIEQGVTRPVTAGLLDAVNNVAQAEDQAVAELISAGQIDGLILVSANPHGINKASVTAAVQQQVPVAGSGGSSVAAAEAMGTRFVSASGTTGTTNHTRAISYAAGFSRAWKTGYQVLDLPRNPRELWRRYDPRPILVDSLPAILAIAAAIGLSRHLPGSTSTRIVNLALPLMPLSISLTAASRTSNVGQAGLLAGAIAGGLALDAGFLGGLVAGLLAGTLADVLVTSALRYRWPATTANILGSGLAGLLAGAATRLALRVPGTGLDRAVERAVASSLAHAGLLVGLCLGALMWPILMKGLYHSVILPLMVIEFTAGGRSFLAAIDMITLVTVSAGIAIATTAFPRRNQDRPSARHTLIVNVCFGTFVEGSFPQIKSHRGYLAVAAVAAAGAIVGLTRSYGVTYIPIFGLPVIGAPWLGLLVAIVVTLVAAFLGAAALNLLLRRADSIRDHAAAAADHQTVTSDTPS